VAARAALAMRRRRLEELQPVRCVVHSVRVDDGVIEQQAGGSVSARCCVRNAGRGSCIARLPDWHIDIDIGSDIYHRHLHSGPRPSIFVLDSSAVVLYGHSGTGELLRARILSIACAWYLPRQGLPALRRRLGRWRRSGRRRAAGVGARLNRGLPSWAIIAHREGLARLSGPSAAPIRQLAVMKCEMQQRSCEPSSV